MWISKYAFAELFLPGCTFSKCTIGLRTFPKLTQPRLNGFSGANLKLRKMSLGIVSQNGSPGKIVAYTGLQEKLVLVNLR